LNLNFSTTCRGLMVVIKTVAIIYALLRLCIWRIHNLSARCRWRESNGRIQSIIRNISHHFHWLFCSRFQVNSHWYRMLSFPKRNQTRIVIRTRVYRGLIWSKHVQYLRENASVYIRSTIVTLGICDKLYSMPLYRMRIITL
jgi:hypothetical protein